MSYQSPTVDCTAIKDTSPSHVSESLEGFSDISATDALVRAGLQIDAAIVRPDEHMSARRAEAPPKSASDEIAVQIVAALQVRKYRRAPAFKEDLLLARVRHALQTGEPLEFLAFWGCGDRRDIADVDDRALEAMKAVTSEPGRLGPIRSHTHVVFMDIHARLNGRADEHANHYFDVIQTAHANEHRTFQRESRTFERYGLTIDEIVEYEKSDEFNEFWLTFPLREKFVTQACRHSNNTDSTYAARRYLATCRKERALFAAAFPNAIFLTYNGPEFNDCFPDVPTLYVYPGPRGPTVKPWFR